MLLAMDRSPSGAFLIDFDKNGITDNTIVIFLNDNGGGGNTTSIRIGHSRNFANNKPLSGHKFDVLEGGVRVPMIMRWPKHAPAGKVYGEMVSSTDVYPTLVAGAWFADAQGPTHRRRGLASLYQRTRTHPNRTNGSAGRIVAGCPGKTAARSSPDRKSTTPPFERETGNSCV